MEANKIIITGGATRIGAAIAKKLSGPNKEILIHYNKSKSKAESLRKELEKNGTKIYLVKGDLSKEVDVNKIVKYAKSKLKYFDCLINNASLTNCRLVFSASINIGTLNFSLPDFDSRIRKFNSYEMFSVQDQNLNLALMHIANFRSINLGEKEANYLLSYTKRNLSDLVGIIERLDSLSMELKRKITIPLIKDYL